VRGIPAWVEFFQALRAAFPDMTTTLEHLLGEGDLVAVRHIWRGTHEGDYEGIAPTGRQVTFTGADIYRIVDGKIVEEWSEFDELGILRQLGADVGASSPSGTE
jgi:predicted ester cyclase